MEPIDRSIVDQGLAEMADQTWTLFREYQNKGFNEGQAMRLVLNYQANTIISAMGRNKGGDNV